MPRFAESYSLDRTQSPCSCENRAIRARPQVLPQHDGGSRPLHGSTHNANQLQHSHSCREGATFAEVFFFHTKFFFHSFAHLRSWKKNSMLHALIPTRHAFDKSSHAGAAFLTKAGFHVTLLPGHSSIFSAYAYGANTVVGPAAGDDDIIVFVHDDVHFHGLSPHSFVRLLRSPLARHRMTGFSPISSFLSTCKLTARVAGGRWRGATITAGCTSTRAY